MLSTSCRLTSQMSCSTRQRFQLPLRYACSVRGRFRGHTSPLMNFEIYWLVSDTTYEPRAAHPTESNLEDEYDDEGNRSPFSRLCLVWKVFNRNKHSHRNRTYERSQQRCYGTHIQLIPAPYSQKQSRTLSSFGPIALSQTA